MAQSRPTTTTDGAKALATGGYFGDGWALWRGGPVAVTGSVRNFTSYDEQMLTPVFVENDGGGDAALTNFSGKAQGLTVWRGVVQAGGGSGNLLALGIVDFYDLFPEALDLGSDFTSVGQSASNGSGHHNVWIASVGA
jgi:hypothetical protein